MAKSRKTNSKLRSSRLSERLTIDATLKIRFVGSFHGEHSWIVGVTAPCSLRRRRLCAGDILYVCMYAVLLEPIKASLINANFNNSHKWREPQESLLAQIEKQQSPRSLCQFSAPFTFLWFLFSIGTLIMLCSHTHADTHTDTDAVKLQIQPKQQQQIQIQFGAGQSVAVSRSLSCSCLICHKRRTS